MPKRQQREVIRLYGSARRLIEIRNGKEINRNQKNKNTGESGQTRKEIINLIRGRE